MGEHARRKSLSAQSTEVADTADYHAETHIAHESNGCVIAVWKDISIGIWGRSATLPLIVELEKVRERVSGEYPKTSTIHVLVNDAGLPNPEARKKLEEITAEAEARLIGVATVVSGDGFRVGALRGFLTSMHWIKRRPYRARVCSSIRDAVTWLAPLHSRQSVLVDADALEWLILRLCERVTATPAAAP